MPCSEVLRLRPGVSLAVDRSSRAYLLHRTASQQLGTLTESQRGALRQLAEAEWPPEVLRASARKTSGDRGVEELERLLNELRTGGWLNVTVFCDGRPAYTTEPYRSPPKPDPDTGGHALA